MTGKLKVGRHDNKIYEWVVAYMVEHLGNPPTIREIRAGLSIPSTSTVGFAVKRLKKRGLISFEDGLTRNIQIVGSWWVANGVSISGMTGEQIEAKFAELGRLQTLCDQQRGEIEDLKRKLADTDARITDEFGIGEGT